MKFWSKVLIPVLVLGLVGIADAKAKKGAKEPAIKGTIVSVAADGTIVVKDGKKKAGTDITVHTDASTKVTIGGTAGKAVSDLVKGEKVKVKSNSGVAKSIKAKAAKGKKAKAGKHKKKK